MSDEADPMPEVSSMSTCSCGARRCDTHGDHEPCLACAEIALDLTAREVATLRSLALGASVALDGPDEQVLQGLQDRGLASKVRRAWVATPAGHTAVTRAPRVPIFVERAG